MGKEFENSHHDHYQDYGDDDDYNMMAIMIMIMIMMMMMSSTLNWVQEDVAKFLQCSSIDSMLPSLPESGASLDLYLKVCTYLYW